ncbi:TPR repeat-containing protein [Duganella sp. CF458]|uniref:tetratricopeptide repeat protein n=1 Tax=Duganella sp. CF458 TaxID=1884368 RepID=UPI0008F13EB6|nr:tetratricopeptide repeat protein [Duganella sp. CF458]SFF57060.1 TPR repeat-containing protein [Duganella sp. CF458]
MNDLERAEELNDQGIAHHEAGDDELALQAYEEALRLNPGAAKTLYNMGLVYKYRNDWRKCFEYNQRAYTLRPDDEASRWNLAIAATALRDWASARKAWADNGIELDGVAGPINGDYGPTPVRLNPDGDGEVVWGTRIDPVRAILRNIPYPESGFRCGDIILHDGAGVGSRVSRGREYMVFNVLELFEASKLSTFCLEVKEATEQQMAALEAAFNAADMPFEDWTANVRTLCKACSEGVPHEHAEDDQQAPQWNPTRLAGIAATSFEAIEAILDQVPGIAQMQVEISLELEAPAD